MTAVAVFGLPFVSFSAPRDDEPVLAAYQEARQYAPLTDPLSGERHAVPAGDRPCTFSWRDGGGKADTWLVLVGLPDDPGRLSFLSSQTRMDASGRRNGRQSSSVAGGSRQRVTVLGFRREAPAQILSRGQVRISNVRGPGGRAAVLPGSESAFCGGRERPFAHPLAVWRDFLDRTRRAVVLEHLPVCGNCHSFSRDGKVLGMDVDYANNKGSYVITRVAKEMALASSDIITWDDYKREDGQKTLGLLSQVSPDGQVVVSTVKDKSVFVARPDLAFSQLFFPVKGILAVYHRDGRRVSGVARARMTPSMCKAIPPGARMGSISSLPAARPTN